jgi:hypothetical protein
MVLQSLAFTDRFPYKSEWRIPFFGFYTAIAITFMSLGRVGFAYGFLLTGLVFLSRVVYLDIVAPFTIALHVFALYFLLVMAFNEELLPSTLVYVLITFTIFILMYFLFPRMNLKFFCRFSSNYFLRTKILTRIAVMQSLGFMLFLISTRLAGFSTPIGVFSEPLQYRFFMMVGGMTYISTLIGFLLFYPVIILTYAYYSGRLGAKPLLVSLLPAALYALACGARGAIIIMAIQILLIRHLLGRKLKVKVVMALAVIAIPYVAIMGEYRMIKYAEESGTLETVIHNLEIKDIVKLTVSRFDASQMFNELMERRRVIEPHYGLSYLEIPIYAIPRSIWPTKPRMPNPEMTRIIDRDDPYLDIAFDFGIFGEVLLNFSWFGAIVGAAILAVGIGIMQSNYERAMKDKLGIDILWCAIFVFLPFTMVVSGLAETIVSFLMSSVNVLVMRMIFFKKITTA